MYLHLLNYFFGYTTVEEPGISFFGEENPEPYIRQQPYVDKAFVEMFTRSHGKSIIALIGIEAIRIAIQKITELDITPQLAILSFSMACIEPTDQSYYSRDWSDLMVYFIRDFAIELGKEDLEIIVDEMCKYQQN